MIERTLGRYKIVGELGRGAMGAVYRAIDPLIEREVAIKTLLPNLPDDVMDEVRERFIREARSAGRLNHPSIVTIFDVGEQDGVAYIAMELLEGRTLQQMLKEGDRLPVHLAAELIAQVADALDAAQQYRIVHRDVKPANIMLGPGGRAKLTDFGVARVDSSSMTQTGAALGSPKYMSPEQVLGQPVDPRSDIFSLGVVLYETLTKHTPFERPTDSTVFSLMNRIAGEPHGSVRKYDGAIPVAFDQILDRALAKKPDNRYQRAGQMAADLRNYRTLKPGQPLADEKTQKLDTGFARSSGASSASVNRPATAEELKARAALMADLDQFTKNFEEEEQERVRAEQEALARKQAELQRWGALEEAKRQQFERHVEGGGDPSVDVSQTMVRRHGALEALRKQSAPAPQPEQTATTREERSARAKALAATLDVALRSANEYLAQLVKEMNSVGPVSGRPYEFLYFGKLVSPKLSDARIDTRMAEIDGRKMLEHVNLRFRVAPLEPARARVTGEDILRCKQYLESIGAEFKGQAEERNAAGKITRAQFTAPAGLPCEINVRGDYATAAVLIELVNVRRVGKLQARIPCDLLGDVVDDLARYAIGVDDDFEKVLKIAK